MSVPGRSKRLNEYKKLKKAMNAYRTFNEDLLQEATESGNIEETEKRERRLKAINECMVIMCKAK